MMLTSYNPFILETSKERKSENKNKYLFISCDFLHFTSSLFFFVSYEQRRVTPVYKRHVRQEATSNDVPQNNNEAGIHVKALPVRGRSRESIYKVAMQ